jgi:hypothetical protein
VAPKDVCKKLAHQAISSFDTSLLYFAGAATVAEPCNACERALNFAMHEITLFLVFLVLQHEDLQLEQLFSSSARRIYFI